MSVLTRRVVGCIGRENFFLLVRVYAGYRNDYSFLAKIAPEGKVVRGHLFLRCPCVLYASADVLGSDTENPVLAF